MILGVQPCFTSGTWTTSRLSQSNFSHAGLRALVWVQADPSITDQRMRLGRSKRKTLRWAENQLRKRFDSEFRVLSGENFSEAFDEFIDLHQRRFDSISRTTLLVGPNLEFLKAATLKLSHTDNFEIVQLRAGDRTIAATLMVRDKRRYFCVQTGFDPEFSRFSPMLRSRAGIRALQI